jgi:FMN phosphatase YigB (HAD superfamily)
MRAKLVALKKAYIFDFDDTLVKTDAKVRVYKDSVLIRILTPEEFNHYIKGLDETLDLSEFTDPRIILQARPYKMWPALKNMDTAIKQGRSTSEIFILTARSPVAQTAIWNFFKRNGIESERIGVVENGFLKTDVFKRIDVKLIRKSEKEFLKKEFHGQNSRKKNAEGLR